MKKSQSALWSANVDLKKNSQLKKFCDQLESKGFIRNDYKKKLVDLSDIRINLKGKK